MAQARPAVKTAEGYREREEKQREEIKRVLLLSSRHLRRLFVSRSSSDGFSLHSDPQVYTHKGVQYKRAILLMMLDSHSESEENQNAAAVAAQVFAGTSVRAGPEK